MKPITNILLIPNTVKAIPEESIAAIASRLTGQGCRVGVLPEYAERLSYLGGAVSYTGESGDAALVLGGDGSIIEASHRLLGRDIPIIGINYGHVGFLSEIGIGELHLLERLLTGNYAVEERMMLDAQVTDERGSVRGVFTVLNDIVLTNGPVSRLISFDVFCGGVRFETCRADGMIAATPTGSTAYSLSAGGPVLDPSLEAFCLTPICPHTLSSRPVIFRGDAVIRYTNIQLNGASVYLNADGREDLAIREGDTVEVRRSAHVTRLLRVREDSFLGVLHAKLSQ